MLGEEAFPEANRADECANHSVYQDAVQSCWCTLCSVPWYQAHQNCCNGRQQPECSNLWIRAASCGMCFGASCGVVFSLKLVDLLERATILIRHDRMQIQPAATMDALQEQKYVRT